MKILMLALVLVSLDCCTLLLQADPPQAARSHKKQNQALLIKLDVPNAIVKIGSSFDATVVMTNVSHKPIDIGFGSWESWGLVVRDSRGNEPLTELERCMRSSLACNTSSNPWGQCPDEEKDCSNWFNLPLGGGPTGIMLDPGKSSGPIPAETRRMEYDLTRPGGYSLQYQVRYSEDLVFKSNIVRLMLVP